MNSITFYDPNTGKITGYMSADAESTEYTKQVEISINGVWSQDKYYVIDEAPVLRPDNTATISGNTLQNLPVPCKIAINGVIYDCDDQTATLGLTQPIKYAIVVSAFPYLDKEFTIDYSA